MSLRYSQNNLLKLHKKLRKKLKSVFKIPKGKEAKFTDRTIRAFKAWIKIQVLIYQVE